MAKKEHVNIWEQEWLDMPEFKQVQILPCKEIIMRFKTEEDVAAFGKLLEQNITDKTKSMWYPKTIRRKKCMHSNKVYTDES